MPTPDPDALEVSLDVSGTDDLAVVPWPLAWQQRVQRRVERSDRYPWVVLAAALFGLFSVGFSITVLTVAIPLIADDLGSSKDVLIWVVTGPMLLGAVVAPTAGKMADLYGARRVFLTAMVLVAVFAGLAALSWSALSLIVFRVLAGAIGSATGPASLAVINRLFPAERRAQALGYWSMVGAGGPVIGVWIGGPIVEAVGWRTIFLAQVPLTLATVALCAAIFPVTPRAARVRFDVAGAVLLALGAGLIVVALNRAPVMGWTHPLVLAGFVLGPLLLVAFVRAERRAESPLIPLRYFRNRNFGFPITNQFFANAAYMGGFTVTPLLLVDVLDFSLTKTGFISTARPLTWAIAGPIAGWVTTKVGERANGVAGGLVLTTSMLAFTLVEPGVSEPFIVGALVLSGLGMGIMAPAMATAIANSVDPHDFGMAGAASQMAGQIGIVFGTQLMVTVEVARASSVGEVAAYGEAYLVGALAAGLATLAALGVRSTLGRWVTRRGAPEGAPGSDESGPSGSGPSEVAYVRR